MSDEDNRLVSIVFRQIFQQPPLGFLIERRTELVQEQNTARPEQSPRNRNPLSLTLAEPRADFADPRIQSSRKASHKSRLRHIQNRPHLPVVRLRITHEKILADRPAEESIPLRHID